MFDVSPINSSIDQIENPSIDFGRENETNSADIPLEALKIKNPNLRVLHPNTKVPGRWWGPSPNERATSRWRRNATENASPISARNSSQTHLDADSSVEEYFEATDNPFANSENIATYSPLSSALEDFDPEIRPHMTEPLLPDGSPLDFSAIKKYRGETNIFSATPLARVWEFNSGTDKHEFSILNILADEFENLDEPEKQPNPTLWQQVKKLTIGLTEDEYDDHYPWAKYSIKSVSGSSDGGDGNCEVAGNQS